MNTPEEIARSLRALAAHIRETHSADDVDAKHVELAAAALQSSEARISAYREALAQSKTSLLAALIFAPNPDSTGYRRGVELTVAQVDAALSASEREPRTEIPSSDSTSRIVSARAQRRSR